jgi:micrococcal nuclease
VLSPLLEQQAEVLGPMMMATLAESGGEVQFSGDLGTDFFAAFETTTPTYTRQPTNTPTVFEPTATTTQSLPASASCVPSGERVKALVTKVLAGDTIQVVIREQTYMVKYIGINSPTLGIESEPYALEAAYANQSLVQNQVVTLMKDTSDVDADGASLLRYVFVNNVFVNDEMLRLGMAQEETLPPDTACEAQFQQSQQFAMEQRLGMWKEGGPAPIPSAPAGGTPPATQQPTPPSAQAACDCNGPDLQCDDFPTRADAQACFDSCKAQGFGDKFLMDTNQNGIACEGKTP